MICSLDIRFPSELQKYIFIFLSFLHVDLFEVYLKPYFLDSYRPISKDDLFRVTSNAKYHGPLFQVGDYDPRGFGIIVAPETVLHVSKWVSEFSFEETSLNKRNLCNNI